MKFSTGNLIEFEYCGKYTARILECLPLKQRYKYVLLTKNGSRKFKEHNEEIEFSSIQIDSIAKLVEETPKKPAKTDEAKAETKPKIELTIKNTVFINGVEMRKFELIDLRNKIDDVVAKMD